MFPVMWSLVVVAILAALPATLSRTLLQDDHPVKEITLVLDYITAAPFGIPRTVISVNGQFPSPLIEVTQGDRLVAHIVNNMNQTTVIHWHGIIHRDSPDMDGVPHVTQLLIPAFGTWLYNFTLNEPGSYWYHAHDKGQLLDGLRGPLIVYPKGAPAATGTDLHLTLADWYQDGAFYLINSVFLVPASEGREPIPDGVLAGGIGQRGCTTRPISSALAAGRSVCNYTRLVAKPGGTCANPTVRLRLISMAGFAAFNVTVDGHEMQIVAVDSYPIEPVTVGHVRVNTGQRYDVMLCRTDGLLTGGDGYWIRVYNDNDVSYAPSNYSLGLAILQYSSNDAMYPTSVLGANEYSIGDKLTENGHWIDPYPLSSGVPVPEPTKTIHIDIIFRADAVTGVNMGTFDNVAWTYNPANETETLLQRAMRGDTGPFPANAPTRFFKLGDVVRITLNNTDTGEHPIHLHGQPFWLLAQGKADDGPFDPRTESVNMGTPVMRDTATVNANSYMVLLWKVDIVGAWLFHCHIEWHMSSGLANLFVVQP